MSKLWQKKLQVVNQNNELKLSIVLKGTAELGNNVLWDSFHE